MDALKGIAVALVSSLMVAVLFAYLFRVPIPLWAYIGPFGSADTYQLPVIDVLRSVVVAWLFYGALGGFILLAVLGALTGWVVGRKYAGTAYRNRLIATWGAAAGALPVLVLSVLDFVIGPW